MSRQNIAIIHPNMHIIGGSERLMADLAIGLSKRNFKVSIITGICHPSWLEEFSSVRASLTVKQLGKRALGSYRFWIRMQSFAQELSRRVDSGTQIVFASGFPSPYAAQIFRRRHNGRIACYLHDAPSVLHDRKGIRILPLHWRMFYEIFSALHRNSDIGAVRSSDLVIANSKLTRQVNSQVYGLEEKDIEVVYPGVFPGRLLHSPVDMRRIRDHIRGKSAILFFPNGVQRWRNPSTALKALKQIADDGMLAIFTGGSAEEVTQFERERQRLKLHEIVWRTREFSPSEVLAVYKSSSLVVSTPMRDSFGLIPAEALACGIPAIASRASGVSEVLRDGEEIVCVEPGNPEELVAAMTRLLHDSESTRKIVKSGQQKVLNYLTIDRFVDETFMKLQRLI